MVTQISTNHPRIRQALRSSLCDLGQFTQEEHRVLEKAVRLGWLSKGKGGPFPKIKTVYARPGFDFARDREEGIAELRRAHMLDEARGVAHLFPIVEFD